MRDIDVLQMTDRGIVRRRHAPWGGRRLKAASAAVAVASFAGVLAGVLAGAAWLIAASGVLNAVAWSFVLLAQARKGALVDETFITVAQTDTQGGGPPPPGPA